MSLGQHPLIVPLALLALCALMALLLRPRPNVQNVRNVQTRGSRPRGPTYIPLTLGNVTIDLQPTATETNHVLIGGTSRTGKSTSALPLFDLPIGVLCIALDVTPIEEKVRSVGGRVWTNDPAECDFGLNLLGGASMFASEGLVAGFPKSEGNIGDWQRSAREVIWDGMDVMDGMGIERSLPAIADVLRRPMSDAELGRICRSWARKLSNLDRIIGPTLGGDLDLVDAMRKREKVLCRLNRFLSPDDAPFLSGLLLVHARMVMQVAGVPFIFVIEEAGQAVLAQGHLSPIAQAGAARGVATVLVTQNMSKLPIEVRNNFHVTVSFAQEDKHEREVAADRLELDAEQLRRSALPDKGVGWCYVRAPGVVTTLVHVEQQRPLKSVASPELVGPSDGPSVVGRWEVVERPMVDGWRPWINALPAPRVVTELIPEWVGVDRDWLRIWGGLKRTGLACPLWSPERGLWWDERGCLEQLKGFNRDGRPRCSIQQRDGLTYRETYRAKFGVYPDPSFDHWCDNVRCADPDHGGPCGIGENNQRRAPRRAAFAVAWAQREERRRRRATAQEPYYSGQP